MLSFASAKLDHTQLVAAAAATISAIVTVKSVVLRVDSPGGDALASEVIWRAACLLGQTKPLVRIATQVLVSHSSLCAHWVLRVTKQNSASLGSDACKLLTRLPDTANNRSLRWEVSQPLVDTSFLWHASISLRFPRRSLVLLGSSPHASRLASYLQSSASGQMYARPSCATVVSIFCTAVCELCLYSNTQAPVIILASNFGLVGQCKYRTS